VIQTPPVPGTRLAPGHYVHHPGCPEWGLGQVQSVDGNRVTVNFEHAGKQLINIGVIALVPGRPEDAD